MPDKISDAERLLLLQKYFHLHSFYTENNYRTAQNNFAKAPDNDLEALLSLYRAKCYKAAFEQIYKDFSVIMFNF